MTPEHSEDPTSMQVRRAVAGEDEALSWVIEHFSPALHSQAWHRLGPEAARQVEPADLVQEVWLIAVPKLGELIERNGKLTPVLLRFLATTLINRANYHLRRLYRSEEVEPVDGAVSGEIQTRISSGLQLPALREFRESLEEALESLSEEEREVVRLRGLECWSNAEVAKLLEIEPNTAAKRWSRALGHLRERLPGSFLEEID